MPSKEELAKFYQGENTWNQEQIAATERHNALMSLQWTDDESPKTADDYESRVKAVILAAEAVGYQVEHKRIPPFIDQQTHTTTLHQDVLIIFNGPGNVVNTIKVRDGNDSYGVLSAEGWVREEIRIWNQNAAKGRRMAKDGARQLEAMEDAERNEELTVADLVKRIEALEKRLAGDA